MPAGLPRGAGSKKCSAETVELRLEGRLLIGTTGEHPFYARGRGWVAVAELRPGEGVALMSGGWGIVEGVAETGRLEALYNLEVEDDHTYFVGCSQWGFSVWAHNIYDDHESHNMRMRNEVEDVLLARGVDKTRAADIADAGAAPGTDGKKLLDLLRRRKDPNADQVALGEQIDHQIEEVSQQFVDGHGANTTPSMVRARQEQAVRELYDASMEKTGGVLAFAESHAEGREIVRVANRTNPLNPEGIWNSHHGIQAAWAEKHLPGYSRDRAPTQVMATDTRFTPEGFGHPHTRLTTAQAKQSMDRRLHDELRSMVEAQRTVGLPEGTIQASMAQQYRMILALERQSG